LTARKWAPLLLVAAAGCNYATPPSQTTRSFEVPTSARVLSKLGRLSDGKFTHVVIIVQENRSVDNLFRGLKGADTQSYALNSAGQHVTLQPVSFKAPYDVDHEHRAYAIESDSGAMNGFNLVNSSYCAALKGCLPPDVAAYGYVPRKEAQPYFEMATQYAFADRMFQSNEGPSFPAHQYLISGTSTIDQSSTLRVSENPLTPTQGFTGGCDSPPGSLALLMDANGEELQETYPCYDRPTLMDLLSAQGYSWRYYEAKLGPGLWNAPDAIRHLQESSQFSTEVVAPPSKVLADIASENLANVVWVTPTAKASDHAKVTNGSGPSWVASVVNAVGESGYWNNTAIFVTWDDWGGWADHVPPTIYNAYELGFRVPAIVISPYTKKGYVSHVPHEFGSILKFVEKNFGLGSLGTTDVRADDFSDCFNFNRPPRAFEPISAPLKRGYFLKQPLSNEPPDAD
jgi:phospholipase C